MLRSACPVLPISLGRNGTALNPVPASESACALSLRGFRLSFRRGNEEGDIEVSLTRLPCEGSTTTITNHRRERPVDGSHRRDHGRVACAALRAIGFRVIHHRELAAGWVGEDACHVGLQVTRQRRLVAVYRRRRWYQADSLRAGAGLQHGGAGEGGSRCVVSADVR